MELKNLLSDINNLRIHKSNNNLSECGEDKLKEYEFILTELSELKKLRVAYVSSQMEQLLAWERWKVENGNYPEYRTQEQMLNDYLNQ